jgi:hypothetical protein
MRRSALVVIVLACAPSPDARTTATVPDRASFPVVADLLVHRCGTLDCHGQTSRNLRLYGNLGLRLAPGDRPVSKGATSVAEYDEDFASVVGLEPETMTTVVTEAGARPDRLTLIRKARGTDQHKGGALWSAGDAQDRCVTSWLAGATDASDCDLANKTSF